MPILNTLTLTDDDVTDICAALEMCAARIDEWNKCHASAPAWFSAAMADGAAHWRELAGRVRSGAAVPAEGGSR